MGFHHVDRDGLDLFTSWSPTSAPLSAGITGVNHCTWWKPSFSFRPLGLWWKRLPRRLLTCSGDILPIVLGINIRLLITYANFCSRLEFLPRKWFFLLYHMSGCKCFKLLCSASSWMFCCLEISFARYPKSSFSSTKFHKSLGQGQNCCQSLQ